MPITERLPGLTQRARAAGTARRSSVEAWDRTNQVVDHPPIGRSSYCPGLFVCRSFLRPAARGQWR